MKKSQRIILLIEIIAIIIIAVVILYNQFKAEVNDSVILEAGTSTLDINSFLVNKTGNGEFVTDISSINLNKPGRHDINIIVKNKEYNSVLEVVDTIKPKAETVNIISPKNKIVNPLELVKNIEDATDVTAAYKTEPDFTKIGEQQVTIILEDMGKNHTEINAELKIIDIKESVQIEAGSTFDIKPKDFLTNTDYKIEIKTDISSIDFSKPSIHEIELIVDENIVKVSIESVDTTAPECTVVNKSIWKGEEVNASNFISDINDASSVNTYFKENPDFSKTGNQEVIIILEDVFKNITEKRAVLTILEDTEAPMISGLGDKTVYIDQTVSYKSGVFVTDNKDKDVELNIDTSDVNIKKEGTYKVIYSATDLNGNQTRKTIYVTVIKQTITEETVYNLIDDILEDITTEDMTKREKAYAIYKWIRGHIGYIGTSDKNDWLKEAHRGITTGYGDCFTYYIVSELFLTRAGIDNMMVKRVGGSSNHYWNLINCGDGWYHFDSCTHIDRKETFMMTDAEVAQFTKERGINYYVFDKSQYPATPKE